MLRSRDLYKRITESLNLPPRVVSLNIRLNINDPVVVECEFYPDEDAFDDDGGLITAFKSYDLVEKEGAD